MGPSIWCSTYRAYGVCHSASALWQKQFIHFSYLEGCRRTTGSRCYTTGLCDRPCENRASCITIVVTMFASTLTVSWIFRRRGYILRPWEAGFRDPDCHQGALGSLPAASALERPWQDAAPFSVEKPSQSHDLLAIGNPQVAQQAFYGLYIWATKAQRLSIYHISPEKAHIRDK